ncbi:peptide-methionine (S)-S-oxide reductase [Halalkalibacter akibai]|uniref:peptide-methionine (S)-S-oxide reductase n=1 Tax=Halalkalibacter akibai (strain ATCC 43226 / DSM 21942 / CIP 109018 / JCM 9157 / 1139) TaxID=1236973 RepID=W4QQW5_HALA3|nr:peptide-methionine (S)-S-oxide reductase [Halalkalibacter akibai]GAE34033.1 hypothetical protein JCM9157_1063 [Halalkalibacter akibai JCM 9157]
MERAVFGASGFFSQEAFITGFRGIDHVQVRQVKRTNIEIVEILFDPWKVSYQQLVDLFFDLHDPTTTEGQSLIFFSNLRQLTVAKQKKVNLRLQVGNVMTDIIPVGQLSS